MGAAESTAKADFDSMDFYEILGISEGATSDEIKVSPREVMVLPLTGIDRFTIVLRSVRIANEHLNTTQIRTRTIYKVQTNGSRKCMRPTK
jgi:DnaJ-class molecular chaperone with C-terminal Zn finger domain